MQMKVLWSTLLLLAAAPSVLSQSGTAPPLAPSVAFHRAGCFDPRDSFAPPVIIAITWSCVGSERERGR